MSQNKPVSIKLITLSPIHIGSGSKIGSVEYFLEGEYFYRVDMEKFINKLSKDNIEVFIKEAAKGKKIDSMIKNKQILKRFILYKLKVHKSALNKQSKSVEVNLHIRSAGKPYIPGSSIKGSLLSGLYYSLIKENNIRIRKFQETQDEVFKKFGGNDRFFHWIDVSDTDLKAPEDVLELGYIEVKEFNDIGKNKKDIPMFSEIIKQGTTFNFTIKKREKFRFSIKDILKRADEFYRKVAIKYNQKLPEDGYILRLGQGSGIFSTSFLIVAEELNIKEYKIKRHKPPIPIKPGENPITRKMIADQQLGWVKLEFFDKS